MASYRVDGDDPAEGKFHFISMLPCSKVTRPDSTVQIIRDSGQDHDARPVDFIAFHGPHFGDRYRILDTALDCLEKAGLPLVLAGCTGASINLVLPQGQGRAAREALSRGFEAP
ncbi:MAG: hypothetical protein MI684_00400 [Chlorobiales bacterium]|nr:hypothetical protein [Chlorobiales bacterium]